jgi:hypothetical protein
MEPIVKLSDQEKDDLYKKWQRSRMSKPQKRALKKAKK